MRFLAFFFFRFQNISMISIVLLVFIHVDTIIVRASPSSSFCCVHTHVATFEKSAGRERAGGGGVGRTHVFSMPNRSTVAEIPFTTRPPGNGTTVCWSLLQESDWLVVMANQLLLYFLTKIVGNHRTYQDIHIPTDRNKPERGEACTWVHAYSSSTCLCDAVSANVPFRTKHWLQPKLVYATTSAVVVDSATRPIAQSFKTRFVLGFALRKATWFHKDGGAGGVSAPSNAM